MPIEHSPLLPKSAGSTCMPMIPNFNIFQLLMSFEECIKQATVTARLCGNVGCLSYKIFSLTFLESRDSKVEKFHIFGTHHVPTSLHLYNNLYNIWQVLFPFLQVWKLRIRKLTCP